MLDWENKYKMKEVEIMMNEDKFKLKYLLTHSYRVVIFENGRFCFRRVGWVRSSLSVNLLTAVVVWSLAALVWGLA